MLFFLCIFAVVIYVISVPIWVKVKADIDFNLLGGTAAVFLFGIVIINFEFEVGTTDGLCLKITNKKKEKTVCLSLGKKNNQRDGGRKSKKFDFNLVGNLNVREICIKMNFGSGNTFKDVMVISGARAVFNSAISVLRSKQSIYVSEEFVPEFTVKAFRLEMCGIISLSLADIIYGFLTSKSHKFRRWMNQKRGKKKAKNLSVIKGRIA